MSIDKEKLKALAEASLIGDWYEPGDLRYEDRKTGDLHGLHHDDDILIACTGPSVILALLAEVERLQEHKQSLIDLRETHGFDSWAAALVKIDRLEQKNANQAESIREYQDLVMGGDVSLGMLKADVRVTTGERDQLKAERELLQLAGESLREEVKRLKAENEDLKNRVEELSPFRGAPLSGQDTRCLACGGFHYGLSGLPCPSMKVTAS